MSCAIGCVWKATIGAVYRARPICDTLVRRHELTVALAHSGGQPIDFDELARAFGMEHERTYGHQAASEEVECVSLRITQNDIPNFEGSLRPVTIILPEGTIVNPRPPAACAARAIVGWRAIDTLMGVFAQIVPDRVGAAGESGVTFRAISGCHHGRRYVVAETLAGSWGAMRDRDGVFGIPNPGGNLTNQPIEMIEALYPLEIERYGMAENIGGPGRQRGAPGIIRQYRMLGDETLVVMRADRQRYLPWDMDGGSPGTPSYHLVNPGPRQRVLPQNPREAVRIGKNEVFCHVGAGGAGVGDPLDREPQHVLDDVVEERITVLYAREVYGVLIEAGNVDLLGTASERDRLRTHRLPRTPAYLRHFLRPLGISECWLDGKREFSARTSGLQRQ